MYRLAAIIVMLALSACGASSMENSNYVGSWSNTHPISKGESNTLEISDKYRVSFTRSFSNEHPDQSLATETDGIRFVDDLAIIDLHWATGELAYKIVLSGWSNSGRRMIFGTMYLYRDGKVFNGLPASFTADD
jgi:hypothetical protein